MSKPPPPPSYTQQPQAQYSTQADFGMQGANNPPPPMAGGYVQGANNPPPPPPMTGGYVQGGAGYVQPAPYIQQQPGSVVVIQQPIKLHSRHPTVVTCQHCHQTVTTSTRSEVGTVTWLACGAMIVFGFWLGCCLIPFCLPDLQDTFHECPSCGKVIDIYKPM